MRRTGKAATPMKEMASWGASMQGMDSASMASCHISAVSWSGAVATGVHWISSSSSSSLCSLDGRLSWVKVCTVIRLSAD